VPPTARASVALAVGRASGQRASGSWEDHGDFMGISWIMDFVIFYIPEQLNITKSL
jgi:hypothetical protein